MTEKEALENVQGEEFLKLIPHPNSNLIRQKEENGLVTLFVKEDGRLNKLLVKMCIKSPVYQIRFEEQGSFIWKEIDGKRTIGKIASDFHVRFGELNNPLYPQLVNYFSSLKEKKFIDFDTTPVDK